MNLPAERAARNTAATGSAPGRQRLTLEPTRPSKTVQRALAGRVIEPPMPGIFCQFCGGPVNATLLNDFLEHLASSHNLRLYSVLLGQRTLIRTDEGTVEVERT